MAVTDPSVFIGLLEPVSHQLREVGNTTNFKHLVEYTKVLMVVDDSSREIAIVQSETFKLPNLKLKSKNLQ